MNGIVFLNGTFLPQRDARVSILGPGFLYGWGLFETMRSYHSAIPYLDGHLKRLIGSCRALDIRRPVSLSGLKQSIHKTVRVNRLTDAYVRLTVSKAEQGADILIMAKKYRPYSSRKYSQGFSACVGEFHQSENSFLASHKTTNYLFYRLNLLGAQTKGFDEALILNNRGYVTEGSRSNVFLVKEGSLFTPSLDCGCLAGITRMAIFDLARRYHIKICEGNFTTQDLYSADEVFLTNSLMGIMPLASLGQKKVGNKTRTLTLFLRKKYHRLFYGI